MKHIGTFNMLALALATLALPSSASAQSYPERPIRIIVPYAVGGVPDVVARIISRNLNKELGWNVFVENKPGAKGAVAVGIMKAAVADGYTFMITDSSTVTINPQLYKTLNYDSKKDFSYVSLIAHSPLYLVVNQNVPAKTIDEFIQYTKTKPAGVNYGSSGLGTIHHLATEALKSGLGIKMTHVPFRGSSASVPALISGQVDTIFAAYSSVVGFLKSDKLRLLGVSTLDRSELTPEISAISDKVPGFNFAVLIAALAPAGTPNDIVQQVSQQVANAVKRDDVIEQLRVLGITPIGGGPADLARAFDDESTHVATAIKAAGIQAE